MLPKRGRRLPTWKGALAGRQDYAETIADLLRREHGGSHRAVKQIMSMTDASERTVKHWMAGQHGPDTVFFLRLLTNSPVIRAFVLGLIESAQTAELAHQRAAQLRTFGAPVMQEPQTSRQDWPENGHINDPESVPINDPMNEALNDRQRWFLARVGAGHFCRADDISADWKVSLKTARRDIAGLCSSGHIRFVGARRNGRYRIIA